MTETLKPCQQILIVLGMFRDDMPPEAVREFQGIADELQNARAPDDVAQIVAFTRAAAEVQRAYHAGTILDALADAIEREFGKDKDDG